MMQIYEIFYKRFGLRRLQSLLSPHVFELEEFNFTRNCIYHYVTHAEGNHYPDPNMGYFTSLSKRIYTEQISELSSHKGMPKRNSKMINLLARPFHIEHKHFKFLKEAHIFNKDQLALTLINYGYLDELYRYQPVIMSDYFKWFNIEKTAWDYGKKVLDESDRQNFYFINLPDILPSVSLLNIFSTRTSSALLKVFNSPEKLGILEIWKWIDPATRSTSTLGDFTDEQLHRTNLVFIANAKWTILNLGLFNSWIKKENNEPTEDTNVINFSAHTMQKYFLKYLISIQSSGVIIDSEESENNGENEDESTDSDFSNDDINNDNVITTTVNLNVAKINNNVASLHTALKEADEVEETVDDAVDFSKALKALDDDLDVLDKINNQILLARGVKASTDTNDASDTDEQTSTVEVSKATIDDIKETIYKELTPNEKLVESIKDYATFGVLSPSEIKSTLKLAESFHAIKDPYGTYKPIEEFIKINPEDLKIDSEDSKLKDSPTIIDKTMLESRLSVFDKDYIKNVMHKDIAGMVVGVQSAGIILQSYDVETEASVLGSFDVHTLKLKPIDAVSSIIRFKLPVVDPNGEFKMSGNKYRSRKQRADYKFYLR